MKKFNMNKNSIYKEALEIHSKNMTKSILIGITIAILVFIAIAYEFHRFEKNCIEQCEKEKITDNGNDHCY